jgi:PAS domain-containing protein
MSVANRALDATVRDLPVGLVVFNTDLTVRSASNRAEQICGLALPPGTPIASFDGVLLASTSDVAAMAASVLGEPPKPRVFRAVTRSPDGEQVRLSVGMRPLCDDSGVVVGMTMTLLPG